MATIHSGNKPGFKHAFVRDLATVFKENNMIIYPQNHGQMQVVSMFYLAGLYTFLGIVSIRALYPFFIKNLGLF